MMGFAKNFMTLIRPNNDWMISLVPKARNQMRQLKELDSFVELLKTTTNLDDVSSTVSQL